MKYLFVIITLLLSCGAFAKVEVITSVAQAKKFFDTNKPVVVMIGADWCGACKQALPHFEKASEFYKGKVKFAYFKEIGIRGLDVKYYPSFAAGKTVKELRSAKSLNKNENRFVPGLVEFTTKYTGVTP